jgi:uncharacterized damage-inducible protein DinB
MHEYFLRLFTFNNWANQLTCLSVIKHQLKDEKITALLSHLVHAQSNWYKRITEKQADQPVWSLVELFQIPLLLEQNGNLWLEYLKEREDDFFRKSIPYTNMAGQPYLNTVQDILVHVVNHATYHRGQVIGRIRELGCVPPATDYIIYAQLQPIGKNSNG